MLVFFIQAESEFTIHLLNLGYSEIAPSHAEHRFGQACRYHYYCYYFCFIAKYFTVKCIKIKY